MKVAKWQESLSHSFCRLHANVNSSGGGNEDLVRTSAAFFLFFRLKRFRRESLMTTVLHHPCLFLHPSTVSCNNQHPFFFYCSVFYCCDFLCGNTYLWEYLECHCMIRKKMEQIKWVNKLWDRKWHMKVHNHLSPSVIVEMSGFCSVCCHLMLKGLIYSWFVFFSAFLRVSYLSLSIWGLKIQQYLLLT